MNLIRLGWAFKQGHQLYIGMDVGHVSGPSAQWLLGQTLAGAAVGVRGQVKAGGSLHYDLFTSRALRKIQMTIMGILKHMIKVHMKAVKLLKIAE